MAEKFTLKATGIVRRIDDLGRIVIPKEVRRTLRLREGDPMELFTQGDMICFRKYNPMLSVSQAVKDAKEIVHDTMMEYGGTLENVTAMKEAEKLLQQAHEKIRQAENN